MPASGAPFTSQSPLVKRVPGTIGQTLNDFPLFVGQFSPILHALIAATRASTCNGHSTSLRLAQGRHSVAAAAVNQTVIKFACLRPLLHRVIYLRLCGLQPHKQLAASSLGKEK